jgi:zinc transport system permease protein
MIDFFQNIFEYKFLINALWAALFASITCGLIGTYIVANRIVFLSGGITHSSFGGIGIAYFLGWNPILGAALFSILSALGIEYFTEKGKVRNDSVIGIWWSLGMAIGIIFIYLTPGYAPNLMTYLFGSILTVSDTNLFYMAIFSLVVVLFFIIFFKNILFISFDEKYAKAQGLPVTLIKNLVLVLVALTIVLNIKVVGIILLISLLTVPQSIANFFTQTFKNIILLSMLIGFIGIIAGLIISYTLNIPSGASIIFSLIVLFGISKLFLIIANRYKISKIQQNNRK